MRRSGIGVRSNNFGDGEKQDSRAEEKNLQWNAVGQTAVPQLYQCILDIQGKTNAVT